MDAQDAQDAQDEQDEQDEQDGKAPLGEAGSNDRRKRCLKILVFFVANNSHLTLSPL